MLKKSYESKITFASPIINLFARRKTYPQISNHDKMSICKHCFSIIDDMNDICERLTKMEKKILELETKLNEKDIILQDDLPDENDTFINDFHVKMRSLISFDEFE